LISRQIHKVEKIRDRETIFLDHYAWLLDWALRLSRGSKEQAEDLVQDLYVRFVQSKAELDTTNEDSLRGYLYKTLRNLSISNGLGGGTDAISRSPKLSVYSTPTVPRRNRVSLRQGQQISTHEGLHRTLAPPLRMRSQADTTSLGERAREGWTVLAVHSLEEDRERAPKRFR
jgi:hypothetical protein